MNKKELIESVASSTGESKASVERVVNETFEGIAKELAKGGEVAIPSFGNFVVRRREARAGRNPQTGATIQIAASNAVGFKVSSVLKKSVNS